MKKRRLRRMIQIVAAALSNGYVIGFVKGTIYQGSLKNFCVPGLNCYSCPGAIGSCPIGALQSVIGSQGKSISFYVIGFLMAVGAAAGRAVCGYLCPFGLIQDLLYKIPFVNKRKNLPGHQILKYLKYGVLAILVILMPLIFVDLVGQGTPWFCKLICPAGTLEGGWILALFNENLRPALGWLFTWKSFLLILLTFLSVAFYRPFCKYLCPLGAIYSFFNPIALYRFRIDEEKCICCGICSKVCPIEIPVRQKPNSPECIRCGTCRQACPSAAILSSLDSFRGKCL